MSATLEAIYDSALDARRWGGALDLLVRDMGGQTASLLVHDHRDAQYTVNHLSAVYRDMLASGTGQVYLERFAHLERRQFEVLGGKPAGVAFRDTELSVSREELDARGDYRFLRQHASIVRRIGVRLNGQKGWFDALTVGFRPEVGDPPPAAFDALRRLLPHLAKGVEIERTFAELRARYNAVLQVLDRIRLGIILVLRNGDILLVNAEADRLLAEADGLRRGRLGKPVCDQPDQSAELLVHVAALAATSLGENGAAARHMRVERRSGRSPLLVDFAPIRDASDELGERFAGAMMLVVDPERSEELRLAPFATLCTLTGAEAAVCELMVQGLTAPEIAERRGRSVATVRNQVKAVYAKTGVSDRGSLVRLIVKTLPPVI